MLRVALRVENRGETDAGRVHVDIDYGGSRIPQSSMDAKPVRAGNYAVFALHNLPLDSARSDRMADKLRLRVWCEETGAETHWP